MTQIFLVTQNAGGSFPDPGNWGPNNSVEIVGAGGYGGATGGLGCDAPPCRAQEPRMPGELVYEWDNSPVVGRATGRVGRGPQFVWRGTIPWTPQELNWTAATDPDTDGAVPRTVTHSGNGGGGGGYGRGTNLTVTFPWPYYVQGTVASSGGFTYYTIWGQSSGSSSPPQTPGWVWAGCGRGGQDGMVGGAAGWPTGFAGGNGGTGNPSQVSVNGGGGGGAAGPHGPGAAGQAWNTGSGGGAADNGTVAGGAAGSPGSSGIQFDATHGAGSGGGSGISTSFPGKAGGSYGGGSGGSYADPGAGGNVQTPGGPSVIVITYIPNAPTLLHYGIVQGVTTKLVYMTVKSDRLDDNDLNNPAWLQLGGTNGGEALRMLLIDRMTYNSWTSFSQLVAWAQAQP